MFRMFCVANWRHICEHSLQNVFDLVKKKFKSIKLINNRIQKSGITQAELESNDDETFDIEVMFEKARNIVGELRRTARSKQVSSSSTSTATTTQKRRRNDDNVENNNNDDESAVVVATSSSSSSSMPLLSDEQRRILESLFALVQESHGSFISLFQW